MNDGMIRCLAVMRAMGDEEPAPPPRESPRSSLVGLAILLASFAVAILGASALASDLHTDRYYWIGGRDVPAGTSLATRQKCVASRCSPTRDRP